MHYSSLVKTKIRDLRSKGYSLGEIHHKTKIAKSTISLWVKNIELSNDQKTALKKKNQQALQMGRIQSQRIRKKIKFERIEKFLTQGKEEINGLSKRELFLIGTALYWAEGFKNIHEHRLGFCNSDPMMIKFYIKWLKEILDVEEKDIILRLTLNESYKNSIGELEAYWAELTGIPLSQFSKPFYQKSIWKKQYNTANYHGILRVHVRSSLDYLLLMRGWIEGLKQSV